MELKINGSDSECAIRPLLYKESFISCQLWECYM